MRIEAVEKDGSRELGEIEPYSIRPGENEPRLMFYCLKRQGTRSLLVSNIVVAEPTGMPFDPRWPVEL